MVSTPGKRRKFRREAIAAAKLGMTTGALRAFLLLSAITVALTAVTWYHGNTQASRLAASQRAQEASQRAQDRTERELKLTVRRLDAAVTRQRREIRSQCHFNGDLASAPVTVSPATGMASELGVKIISDGRVAWRQAGCPGKLAAPSRSFARWAEYYHLPTG